MTACRHILLMVASAALLGAQPEQPRMSFEVTYVAADVIYINGGSDEGLTEGMELEISRLEPGQPLMAAQPVGSVRIQATAPSSAVCTILLNGGGIAKGDHAALSSGDAEQVAYLLTSQNSRKYAQIISFSDYTGEDPLKDELRAYIPKPPLAEINRVKGRISFQQSSLFDGTSGRASSQTGVSIRGEATRLGGTYWNFAGNWRGRISTRRGPETLTDLINRTYHVGFTYDSPYAKNTMGFGRLLLPWASSLNTIDGGYYGRKLGQSATAGAFAGSTPDPSAWNFDPNRQIVGVFSNFETGSFENVRYSGTFGVAHTRRNWRPERQFAFFENTVAVNRRFSVFHNAEVDNRSRGRFGSDTSGPVLSRSFLTVRAEANEYVTLDLSHNYFRGVPTFDDRLIGVGLVDQLLFQGVSGSIRVKLPARSSAYGQLGRSDRRGDESSSFNYLLGYTWGRLPWIHMRADFRTSSFSSSFGSGHYHSVSLSYDLREALRLEMQAGRQDFSGSLTQQNRAIFINSSLEWFFQEDYFLGTGITVYRGNIQDYSQVYFDLGYRF